MLRATVGVIAGAILSAFAYLLIRGQYFKEGPVVLTLSEQHQWGIHRGDILIAGGWLIGMVALGTLVWDRWPHGGDGS